MKPRHRFFLLALVALPAGGQSIPFPGPGAMTSATGGWPNGYAHRLLFTFNAHPSSDLTAFPNLISGTYAGMADTAHGGYINNAVSLNGQTVPADLIFTSDAAGSTLLSWEVESWNNTTGAIVAWVKADRLAASDTLIYAWSGKPTVTTYQCSATATWDSSFKAVWHLGTPSTPKDSTATAANGTDYGATAATGRIGGGAATASSSYLIAPIDLSGTQEATVEAWFYKSSYANNDALLMELTPNAVGGSGGFALDPNSSGGNFEVFSSSTLGETADVTFARPSAGSWHHIAIPIDYSLSTNEITAVYIDGVSQTLTRPLNPDNSGTFANSTLYFMSRAGSSLFTTGTIDEVRISNSVRSAAWVAHEYTQQSQASAWYTVGSWQ